MNYVKNMVYQSSMSTMKLTKENIKLRVNLGTNMNKIDKENLGNLNYNLI